MTRDMVTGEDKAETPEMQQTQAAAGGQGSGAGEARSATKSCSHAEQRQLRPQPAPPGSGETPPASRLWDLARRSLDPLAHTYTVPRSVAECGTDAVAEHGIVTCSRLFAADAVSDAYADDGHVSSVANHPVTHNRVGALASVTAVTAEWDVSNGADPPAPPAAARDAAKVAKLGVYESLKPWLPASTPAQLLPAEAPAPTACPPDGLAPGAAASEELAGPEFEPCALAVLAPRAPACNVWVGGAGMGQGLVAPHVTWAAAVYTCFCVCVHVCVHVSVSTNVYIVCMYVHTRICTYREGACRP